MSKLIMGLSSDFGSWQGDDTLTQIKWFSENQKRVGVAIWDARLLDASWRTKPV